MIGDSSQDPKIFESRRDQSLNSFDISIYNRENGTAIGFSSRSILLDQEQIFPKLHSKPYHSRKYECKNVSSDIFCFSVAKIGLKINKNPFRNRTILEAQKIEKGIEEMRKFTHFKDRSR